MATTSDMNAVIDELKSREEIKELKAKYCRFVDTKQWERFADLFDEKASFEGYRSAPSDADLPTFVRSVAERMASAITIHHCHTPEIVFESPDAARGIWAMEDYIQFPPGTDSADGGGGTGHMGFGHYEERYIRRGGRWYFSFLRITRMRLDALAADHPPPRPGRLGPTLDWI